MSSLHQDVPSSVLAATSNRSTQDSRQAGGLLPTSVHSTKATDEEEDVEVDGVEVEVDLTWSEKRRLPQREKQRAALLYWYTSSAAVAVGGGESEAVSKSSSSMATSKESSSPCPPCPREEDTLNIPLGQHARRQGASSDESVSGQKSRGASGRAASHEDMLAGGVRTCGAFCEKLKLCVNDTRAKFGTFGYFLLLALALRVCFCPNHLFFFAEPDTFP